MSLRRFFEIIFLALIYCLVPRYLIETAGHGIVVKCVNKSVVVVCMCARGAQETLILNVDYYKWRICHITDLLKL